MRLQRRAAITLIGCFVIASCSSSTTTSAPPSTGATTLAPVAASSSAPTTVAPTTTTAAPTTSAALSTTLAATTTAATAATTTAALPAKKSTTIADLLALKRPIVLAHGGGEDSFPHSTLFAHGESAKAGVDMLDLDVQLTKDNVLVVQHDDNVGRQTESTAKVADLTFAEINAFDDAYWFTADCVCKDKPEAAYLYRGIRTGNKPAPLGYTGEDFAIPRFADLAKRFPGLPLNIEIKGVAPAAFPAAAALAKELTALGRLDSVVVTSFDDLVVTEFHRLAPTVEMTPGLGASANWILKREPLPDGMRILQLPPVYTKIDVLTQENIDASLKAGYPIWVWPNDRTLENTASYLTFMKQGIAGLNINLPALGVDAVKQFAK